MSLGSKDPMNDLSPQTQKTIRKIKRLGAGSREIDISEMKAIMDEYAVRGIHVLWEVITDPDHEWHRRFGFEALKVLIQHTLPKRKELAGQVDQNVEVNLSSLFHNNNLEKTKASSDKDIEVEVREAIDIEPEGSGTDS
jgi:hypothetical protein